ncbi:MAG: M14 family metallopeptidase [Chloroflexota bacterium]
MLSACQAQENESEVVVQQSVIVRSSPGPSPTAGSTAVAEQSPGNPTPISMPSATATAVPTLTSTNTPIPTQTPIPFGYKTSIGRSVQQRPIENYRFGQGPLTVIFVGGMHGGYEWNSTLLMYELMDYLHAQPGILPPAITLHIIPAANPDGIYRIVGHNNRFKAGDISGDIFPGRFNANTVDLNRNWDCDWQPTAVWRDQPVSAGDYPFSEPENRHLRDFIEVQNPLVVIFYHSVFDAVFTAGCPDTFPPSRELAEVYGQAAGYPIFDHFPAYEISGDAGDYLAKVGVPAFTVELSTRESTDWERNLAGINAMLSYLLETHTPEFIDCALDQPEPVFCR